MIGSRRRTALLAVIAGLLSASVLPAVGDELVSSYEESSESTETMACATVHSDHHDEVTGNSTSSSITACGGRTDADGEPASAWLDLNRRVCTYRYGELSRCTYDAGSGAVDPAGVLIDPEAGTVEIQSALDGCAVAVSGTAESDDTWGGEDEYLTPDVRLRHLSARLSSGYSSGGSYAAGSDATGSVCDWHQGDFSYLWLASSSDRDTERGYRLEPEDLPAVGQAIARHERPGGESADHEACARWIDESGEATDDAEVCALANDGDGDGSVDSGWLLLSRYRCSAVTCTLVVTISPDLRTYELDVAEGTASFTGTAAADGGLCDVAVTVSGDPGDWRTGHQRSGYDAPGHRGGTEVELGRDGSVRTETLDADPGASSVCDWPEVQSADRSHGRIVRRTSTENAHTVEVRPDALV